MPDTSTRWGTARELQMLDPCFDRFRKAFNEKIITSWHGDVYTRNLTGAIFQANVRAYYQQFEEQQTQSLIDQKVKEHLGQTAAVYQQVQMGGAFHQHLTALGQFKPPIPLPVLPIPVPGSIPAASTHLPSVRLSALPVPGILTAPPTGTWYVMSWDYMIQFRFSTSNSCIDCGASMYVPFPFTNVLYLDQALENLRLLMSLSMTR